MSKAPTKDERFLLKLYELASALGDPEEEIDRYAVGDALSLKQHAVDVLVRTLAQSNFIKKSSDPFIYLTPAGLALIETLR